jgi:carboxylesterase
MPLLMPVAVAGGVGAAVVALRYAASRRVEALVASRLPVAPDGIVDGAATIMLEGGPFSVLILHGFGDTPQSLRGLCYFLHERGWTVRAPLLPGHGRSLRDFASCTAAAWVDATRSAYAELRRTHSVVTILGQSMGGALAVLLAAGAPELPSLVLLAPYLTMMPKVSRIARRSRFLSLTVPYVRSASAESIWDPVERANSLGFGFTPPRLLGELSQITRLAWEAAPSVRAPTLMLQSLQDKRISRRDAESVFERLGAATKELHWLRGRGHVLSVDFGRDEVFARSEGWLRQFGEARGDVRARMGEA